MHDDILKEIEGFLKETGIAPTKFGKLVNNDPSLVAGLRAGRDPRTSTVRRIHQFITQHRVPSGEVSDAR